MKTKAMNVRVSDVSWKVCLDMARNNETFLGEVKMETISLARFERAANSKEVITAIFNATMKTGHDMTQPKAWIKGDKVRIYLAAKGARRNSDMGYLTLENGKVVMGAKSGWTHNTTQEIIAAAEAAIIANISEDDAVEVMARNNETFLGEVKMGTKLKGFEFRKAVKAAIGYSDETMHEITIRETNTQKRVDGKLLKKCFISIEMLGRKAPKGLMASMLWSGDFSDIEEVWLEEIKDKEQDMEFYVLNSNHISSIVSAMKGHHCGCSSIIGMAIGVEFNTNFIELLK